MALLPGKDDSTESTVSGIKELIAGTDGIRTANRVGGASRADVAGGTAIIIGSVDN